MIIFNVTITIIIYSLLAYLICQNFLLRKNIKNRNNAEKFRQSFIATLVHDLKTPTQALFNTLNLLKNENFGPLSNEQREMICLSLESCKYMKELITTIMKTYCLDHRQIKLNIKSFDIKETILQICNETKTLRLERNQTLKINNSITNSNIWADELQIKRVISNLLSNAITYGFKNTEIEINFKVEKNSFEFYVTNMSNQIPPNELKTIFNKYTKTKYSVFNKTSSGLGLYLAKNIIEMHNGKIYAQSNPNGKCTFGFVIPTYNKKTLAKNIIKD